MQKLLLIDDDPDVITLLQLLFKNKKYLVATATLEQDIFHQITLFKPDLILLDVLLSGIDGRDICKKIKNTPSTQHIPVVLFSGHPGAQKNIDNYGAEHFVPKPFSSDKLLELVETQLQKGSTVH